MARSLAALKVTIGLRANGEADHPDFNRLPVVQASNVDWSVYIDKEGEGWVYDGVSGHRDDDVDSPYGQQFGVLLVPLQFVTEALADPIIGPLVTRMTEIEVTDFWNNRAHAHLSDNNRDEAVLTQLSREMALIDDALTDATGPTAVRLTAAKAALRAEVKKALDPDDSTPGVRKNHRKRWADWKAKQSITILEA